jgi:hypothetical protein
MKLEELEKFCFIETADMGEGNFFEKALDAERDAFLMAVDDRGIMISDIRFV